MNERERETLGRVEHAWRESKVNAEVEIAANISALLSARPEHHEGVIKGFRHTDPGVLEAAAARDVANADDFRQAAAIIRKLRGNQ